MSWNRTLSAFLAVVYVLAALLGSGAESACVIGLGAVLPLACIWFSEAMGGYIGPTAHGAITGTTPGIIICIAGWILLLLPLLIVIAYALFDSQKAYEVTAPNAGIAPSFQSEYPCPGVGEFGR
jgi:hypothetical protein